DDESALIAKHLLGDAAIPDDARSRIVAAAEGNPLFVEQLLSMLIDDGLLRQEQGRWVPAGDLSELAIPPTIQALLAARLDLLSAADWAERINRERQRETEFEEILGYHLEQAYQYLSELGPIDDHGLELGRRGAAHLATAGDRAFARGDMAVAANLLRRAATLLPQT